MPMKLKPSFFRKHKGLEVREVTVARDERGLLGFSVRGGVENDMLPEIVIPTPKVHTKVGKLKNGDILLSIDGENVAGETHEEIIRLLQNAGSEVNLTVMFPQGEKLTISSLFASEKLDEAKSKVQSSVKEKIYELVPPLTTRPPREGEEEGRDYHFVSEEDFEKLLKSDRLLEHARRGDYYFGTVKPTQNMLTPERREKRQESFRQHSQSSRKKKEKEPVFQRVVLVKNDQGKFGFGFDAGIEFDLLLSIRIIENVKTVCFTQRPLKKGDCILAINGTSVVASSAQHVGEMLTSTKGPVELTVTCSNTDRIRISSMLKQDLMSEEMKILQKDIKRHVYNRTVPYTTRPKRADEKEGVQYHFVSSAQFDELQSEDFFLEFAEKDGVKYGTPKPDLQVKQIVDDSTSQVTLYSRQKQPLRPREFILERESNSKDFGVHFSSEGENVIVSKIDSHSPADSVGLVSNMKLLALNGNSDFSCVDEVQGLLAEAENRLQLICELQDFMKVESPSIDTNTKAASQASQLFTNKSFFIAAFLGMLLAVLAFVLLQ